MSNQESTEESAPPSNSTVVRGNNSGTVITGNQNRVATGPAQREPPARAEPLVPLGPAGSPWPATPPRPDPGEYVYDVALSFAGEERVYADELAGLLRAQGVRVFYDSFEQAELWGKNLFEHLSSVYAEQSRYCIVFVSKAYADKMWTVQERRAVQERVLRSRQDEYLLPVRVDGTRLPGLPDTVACFDVGVGMENVASQFVRKLRASAAGAT